MTQAEALEFQIDAAYLRLTTATTPEARRSALDDMTTLVKSRHPERVAEMERERGLAT